MKPKMDKLNEIIDNLGIVYTAEFVPFSRSRNAKSDPKINDYSLNWKITISKNRNVLTTDYMQGIGYIPGYVFKYHMTVNQLKNIKTACESGKDYTDHTTIGKKIPPPAWQDVLYSLVMDSSALEYSTFEEWAEDFGYETNSRKAEKIYKLCLEIGLKLRAMLGSDTMEKLREAYSDY